MNKHISKNDKPFLWYILPVSIFIKTDWSQSIWLLPQSNRLSWHYAHVTRPSKGGKSVCRGYVSHYYSWPTSNGKASINELMSSLVFVLAQDSFTAVSRFGLCHSVEWAIYQASRSLSTLPSGCAAEGRYRLLFIDDGIRLDPQCVISTGVKSATMQWVNTIYMIVE